MKNNGLLPGVEQLQEKETWLLGPDWLRRIEEEWPVKDVEELEMTAESRETIDQETKKETVAACIVIPETRSIKNIIDPKRFSSFSRLLRVTSIVRKFIAIRYGRKDFDAEISAEDIAESKEI